MKFSLALTGVAFTVLGVAAASGNPLALQHAGLAIAAIGIMQFFSYISTPHE